MVNPMNVIGLLLLIAAIAVCALLIRRGGSLRSIGIGLLIALLWLISWGVIAAFWYERQGNLDVPLISLLAFIPAVVIGYLVTFASDRRAQS